MTTKNDFANGHAQCAWCGSFETEFKCFLCWDEDEQGNAYVTHDLNDPDHAPREALWHCRDCQDNFAEPLPGEEYPTLPDDFIPAAPDNMDDKNALEIIERVMTDTERVEFGISTMDVYLLISYLQVAYRMPGMSKVLRGHIRHIAGQIVQPVSARYPAAIPIIEKGWDPQFDREQGSMTKAEKAWVEGKKRGRQ